MPGPLADTANSLVRYPARNDESARSGRDVLSCVVTEAVRRGTFMCRSIKTLRAPYTETVTDDDVHAAALQYVRKVSGFRQPAAHNADAFQRAVDEVARATAVLLDELVIGGRPADR